MRPILIVPAALAVACGPAGIAARAPAAAPNAVSTPIARTALTASGQPLRIPQGRSEMVATVVEIPARGSTTIHQHPWSRFVYVDRGPLRVVNEDKRDSHDFQTGQAFAEVVGQWHQGFAPGPRGARLIVFDVVPPGVANMKMR